MTSLRDHKDAEGDGIESGEENHIGSDHRTQSPAYSAELQLLDCGSVGQLDTVYF